MPLSATVSNWGGGEKEGRNLGFLATLTVIDLLVDGWGGGGGEGRGERVT